VADGRVHEPQVVGPPGCCSPINPPDRRSRRPPRRRSGAFPRPRRSGLRPAGPDARKRALRAVRLRSVLVMSCSGHPSRRGSAHDRSSHPGGIAPARGDRHRGRARRSPPGFLPTQAVLHNRLSSGCPGRGTPPPAPALAGLPSTSRGRAAADASQFAADSRRRAAQPAADLPHPVSALAQGGDRCPMSRGDPTGPGRSGQAGRSHPAVLRASPVAGVQDSLSRSSWLLWPRRPTNKPLTYQECCDKPSNPLVDGGPFLVGDDGDGRRASVPHRRAAAVLRPPGSLAAQVGVAAPVPRCSSPHG
jgi:hypothetical protein